jgi:hypothetical protein
MNGETTVIIITDTGVEIQIALRQNASHKAAEEWCGWAKTALENIRDERLKHPEEH